jgi:arginase
VAIKVRILGVPLDLGQERRGVDMGPFALRAAGLNGELRALGHEVEDDGNVAVRILEELPPGDRRAKYLDEIAETSREVAERVRETLDSGRFPLCLGGDHSMAVGTVAGISAHFRARGESVGLVWVDAHADMNTPATTPSGNVHGMTLAASLGLGPEALTGLLGYAPKLDPRRCVLIGVRDLDPEERETVRDSGVYVFTMRDVDEWGMGAVVEQAIALAGDGAAGIAVSFDMDAVDPSEAPGVGTPVPGGITYREAHLAMELLAESERVIALDLVEINPILDSMNRTGKLGVGLILSALGKRIL